MTMQVKDVLRIDNRLATKAHLCRVERSPDFEKRGTLDVDYVS